MGNVFNMVGGGSGGTPWDESYYIPVTVSVVAGDHGSVSGGGQVRQGSSVTVVATADSGYHFVKWTNASGTQVSTNATYTFTATDDVTLTATFEQNVINITLTGTGNTSYCYATINGTKRYGSGTYQVHAGDTITFGVYGRSSTYQGWVKVDGTSIITVTNQTTQTKDWIVPECDSVTIKFSYTSTSSQRRGQITVTTA